MSYNHQEVEAKWQKYWDQNQTFKTDVWDFSKPKYYVLDMFPYPSGSGLHVGHPAGYTGGDIRSRMKRMQGYNVLHPMGFDAFGLPAEQYAIKTGNHPGTFTQENIEVFTKQLKLLGYDYDWSRQVSTADPKFYKWTQWIFGELYKDGLAKYVDMPVNWCEELGTVLSNDEIIDGLSERGGHPVVKKNMKQWIIDIPKYAERLLEGLETIDWPSSTKEMQRNWIGKSVGATVRFDVANTDKSFEVFTTRPDTLFGSTYCVLAPEHELVEVVTTKEQQDAVTEYQKMTARKSDLERTELNKDKSGVFTGGYAINPANGKEVPIWISDYVLVSYGTGAIMAVPAHDERDYEFATKFGLEIVKVLDGDISENAFTGDALHVNSDFLDGLGKEEGINKMIEWLVEKKIGEKSVNYRLREWIFARQRYWGEPVPVIHMEDGTKKVLSLDELPLELPEMDEYLPKVKGAAPLENAPEWFNVEIDGVKGKRETTTMPGSAGSSWYHLRYIDPTNENEIADKELMKHWLPVDFYAGGSEHTVGHLLYSRMWNNFLFDKGVVPVKEPYQQLFHQGMILGENNEKMSKSKGNVINPDQIIESHGTDALRLYIMFMGPLESSKPWNSKGVDGSRRFIDRVVRMMETKEIIDGENKKLEKVYHQTVKKVTEDFENIAYNTAISQMMIFVNECYKEETLPREYAEGFIKMLNPIAPHITEEIWNTVLGHGGTISFESWPTFDESKLIEDTVQIIVQVNGKLRAKINVKRDEDKAEVEKIALAEENVINFTEGKTIRKVIVVPNKIVNIVV